MNSNIVIIIAILKEDANNQEFAIKMNVTIRPNKI
jgi:hypothetical protein